MKFYEIILPMISCIQRKIASADSILQVLKDGENLGILWESFSPDVKRRIICLTTLTVINLIQPS